MDSTPKRLIDASRLAEMALDRLSPGAAGPLSDGIADEARAYLEAVLRVLHQEMEALCG